MPFKTTVLSLTASLAFHTLAIVSFSMPGWRNENSTNQPMEISYVRYTPEKSTIQPPLVLQSPAQIKYPPVMKTESKTKRSVTALKAVSHKFNPVVEKSVDKLPVKIGELELKNEKDFLADPKKEKIFSNYFGLIKQQIHRVFEKSYLQENLGTGDVTLVFVLKSDGVVVNVFPAERSIAADELMKDFAARCIRQCSPFPRFPKELGMERITFNLSIRFDEAT